MSLNSYLTFFLKSEVISYEKEAYQRDKLNFIGRENWSHYVSIINCNCQNETQDSLYGPGKRVFNKTTRGQGTIHRCTVCSAEKSVDGSEVKKKGKK